MRFRNCSMYLERAKCKQKKCKGKMGKWFGITALNRPRLRSKKLSGLPATVGGACFVDVDATNLWLMLHSSIFR